MTPPDTSVALLIGVLVLGMLLGPPLAKAGKAAAQAFKHFLLVGLVLALGYLVLQAVTAP